MSLSASPVPFSSFPTSDSPPITRPGGNHGDRQYAEVGPLELEFGGHLPAVRLAFESWGELSARADNAILVEHALTGDSHVVGPAGPGHLTAGWWEGLIGPGAPLDTDRYFVVAANVLGGCQGSTGPSSERVPGQRWGGDFPQVTIRDQVRVEARLADLLGVRQWAAVLGGSMGGMRALEWAVTFPERVARCLVLASTAAATADQIAWCQAQILAITSDPGYAGGHYYASSGPLAGLGLARRIAHLTYRCEPELAERFGRAPQAGEDPARGGRYAVESYLDHAAAKLSRRFDANSYLVLTQAMNSHDVGRGRGGVAQALSGVTAQCTIADVDSDRCYPPRLSDELARDLPQAKRVTIHSPHGHDGFLIETGQVEAIVGSALNSTL